MTTTYAARPGSSFLSFSHDIEYGTLTGYLKAGRHLTVVVTGDDMYKFAMAPLHLRGKLINDFKIAGRKLTSHVTDLDTFTSKIRGASIAGTDAVVLAAPKQGNFYNFKVTPSQDVFKVECWQKGGSNHVSTCVTPEGLYAFASGGLANRDRTLSAH